ncbi:hypothetical protein UFOVP17_5 [uncultured Caudovirales phage]|uniref:Uncharacterized protein n=1 Tax=uncultured Caudovirales phage TaxID=2100421 RepID=A0A6J5KNK2_9CAUD|nr:hypothetical protein UFOVP17_5 [uncultured Caudovirales phage]
MKLIPKNWEKFQHYKHRSPPWIKLHRDILDDYDWWSLPIASRAIAPCLWLLASCEEDGIFDASPEKLAFRFRMTEKDIQLAVKPLIDKGYFVYADELLAPCYQDAMSEKSKSRDREEKEAEKKFIPPIDSYILSEWIKVRKSKKAVEITELVWKGLVREANKLGWTPEKAVIKCCEKGWVSLDASWINKGNKPSYQTSREIAAQSIFGNVINQQIEKVVDHE